MKYGVKVILLLVLITITFQGSGCTSLFGPSDEEVVKAVMDTGLFSGGVEKYSLKSPIVVLEKSRHMIDGYWEVKIKATVTFTMTGGKEIGPKESTSVFKIHTFKDSSGKTIWKADAGV